MCMSRLLSSFRCGTFIQQRKVVLMNHVTTNTSSVPVPSISLSLGLMFCFVTLICTIGHGLLQVSSGNIVYGVLLVMGGFVSMALVGRGIVRVIPHEIESTSGMRASEEGDHFTIEVAEKPFRIVEEIRSTNQPHCLLVHTKDGLHLYYRVPQIKEETPLLN